MEICKCMARRAADFLDQTDAPLGVDECAFLLAPTRRREQQIGELSGLSRVIHVLHDQKIEPGEDLAKPALVNPRVRRIGADHPKAADLAGLDPLDDLVVCPARPAGDPVFRDLEHAGDLGAMVGVGEVVSAEEVGGVREQPRAHRVALAGNRVGSGAGSAHIAGHQCQVDDCLGGFHPLMALVDAHRPPEGDAGSFVDPRGRVANHASGESGLASHPLYVVRADEGGEVAEATCVRLDIRPVDPSVLDQQVREAIKKHQIGLGPDRQMQ